MTPTIEVCIPVWNEAKSIIKVLDALKAQTYKKFQVVIYDNNSTDDTLQVANLLKEQLNVRYVRRTHNIGQNENINRMLSNARHDFVAPLSANDVVSPNYLETLLKTLLDDPETSVAYSHATYVDDEGQPLVKQPAWAFYSALDDDPIERACLVIEKYCQATQFFALYRKSAVDRMQAQPFCYGGDHVFATEAAIYGKVAYRGDVDTKRSMPPGAGSANARRKHLINLFSLDHQRGLPNRSKIGRFENTTPIIDMFHGHLEMFRLADIDPKDRLILIKRGTRAFLERYQKGVTKDIQRFEKTAGALADSIDTENLATRMMIMNIIRKIDQCLFLQRNEGLVRIRHQLEETFR